MTRSRSLLLVVAVLGVSAYVYAERAPDFTDPDFIVTGEVQAVFRREDDRLTQYVIQIRLDAIEHGEGYTEGEYFYAYCYQREPAIIPQPDDLGHDAVPEEGQRIRALVHRRDGRFEGHFPDWFEVREEAAEE
jgi:hypothetical protein